MTETVARPLPRDRYAATSGRVQLTGVQALARLPIDQHRRDLAAGLNVGTFISGYEGSPLAGYDQELGRLKQLLDANDVTFVPGLNEEAAATSVQGSQLACTLPGAARDGVIGIWYGKAPGLDRATDALRHGNLMGSHPKGGALVLVGDDPAAKSSTLPCASDVALADLSIPYLYPADSQDVLDLGRHAIELSRASGLWTGLKIVTAVADGSSTVNLAADWPAPRIPPGAGTHVPTARLLVFAGELVAVLDQPAPIRAVAQAQPGVVAQDVTGVDAARPVVKRRGAGVETLGDEVEVGIPVVIDAHRKSWFWRSKTLV